MKNTIHESRIDVIELISFLLGIIVLLLFAAIIGRG